MLKYKEGICGGTDGLLYLPINDEFDDFRNVF